MKRFIDTELWEKEWFMDLETHEKCATIYIMTKCDNVGVWNHNFKLADYLVGMGVDWEQLKDKLNGNIKNLGDGKWWLVDYCDFQYGELNESSPPHRSYIQKLKKYNLLNEVMKGYSYPTSTSQDKEIEKEEEKEKENKAPKYSKSFDSRKLRFIESVNDYVVDKKLSPKLVNAFIEYWTEQSQGGRKMRHEMEKTFGISQRMATWKKNDYDGYQAEFEAEIKIKVQKKEIQAINQQNKENSASSKDIKAIMDEAKSKVSKKYHVQRN